MDRLPTRSTSATSRTRSISITARRSASCIVRAEDRVGVAAVPDWAPLQFAPAVGTTAGFVERIGWTQDGSGAEFSRTWFDHDVARYVARLR